MDRTGTFLIVGGGLTAAKAAEGLRAAGFGGRIVLVGDEHESPYERPPLSKGYLAGAEQRQSVFVHAPDWYAEHDVELVLGSPVTGIDVDARTVATAERQFGYDKLLIATGAAARRPAFVGDGGAVGFLRTIDDSDRIRAAMRPGHRIAVVGGGWIGLEVASAARTAGCKVVVLEAGARPLLGVLGPEVAEVFADLHTSHGVDLRTGVSVSSVEDVGGRGIVRLGDGSSVAADFVVVGVGARPNTALAEAAGLKVDNGIVVDEHLRTSHPDVVAAGDVANAYHPVLGRHVRVEHWDNAVEQGLAAARTMLDVGEAYDHLPYFFTDQYDLGMEYVGDVGPDGYDEVLLRGDVAGRVFTGFWVRGGRVVAGMHANDWDAIEPVRRIVGAGDVDLRALRDTTVPLDELAA
ncbi:MAG: NAD(P)/FAD-dependent oxidoreductase [Actinomycetota bacterium]